MPINGQTFNFSGLKGKYPLVRNKVSLYLASLKRLLQSLISQTVQNETFKVNVENSKNYNSALGRIQNEVQKLQKIVSGVTSVKVVNNENHKQILEQVLVPELKQVQDILKEVAGIQFPDTSDKITSSFSENVDKLDKSIQSAINEIKSLQKIPSNIKFPNVQRVTGDVKIPKDQRLDQVIDLLQRLEERVANLKLEVPPQKDIKIPAMPKVIETAEGKQLVQEIKKLQVLIEKLPKNIPELEFPRHISIDNFPPQKYPLPVTNININPLRGEVKTRAITVTTALTPLPDEVLSFRRSLVVYNNGSVTVFVGGSTMTTSDGMPIPAGTYSPAIDAGPRMILYGRTASSSSDVRVMELSNEDIGG